MFALRRDERKGTFPVSGTFNTASACELQPPANDTFIKQHEHMARKAGEALSLPFLARCALAGLIALLPIAAAFSQSASAGPPVSANDLVRAVVANELKPQVGSHGRWMYRVEREEQGKKKTKEVVQTGLGSLDRLVAVNGQPLNAEEQKDESERIGNLVRNPAEQQRLEQTKKKDAEQCKAFFKILPDALTFIYAGRDGDLIKLSYRPNPSFQPPSREARVFHEMEGEMWVHETQRRLVRMRGRLIAEVKFAGGLLGHLEKGGHFNVEQRELLPGQWDLTFMEVDMKGKALLFKTIAVQEKEYRSDFRTVSDGLTLAEAADILTNEVTVAANQ